MCACLPDIGTQMDCGSPQDNRTLSGRVQMVGTIQTGSTSLQDKRCIAMAIKARFDHSNIRVRTDFPDQAQFHEDRNARFYRQLHQRQLFHRNRTLGLVDKIRSVQARSSRPVQCKFPEGMDSRSCWLYLVGSSAQLHNPTE